MKSNTRLKMRQEDYLESIFLLSREYKSVRITDIAVRMGVKKSTAVSMIDKLVEDGFLQHEKYGDVHLNRKGIECAQQVYQRHVTIQSFFKEVLDLPDDVAESDACLTEHHMSDQTFERLLRFMEFYLYQMHHDHSNISELRNYFKTGKYPCSDEECRHIKLLSNLSKGMRGKVLSVRGDSRKVNDLFSRGYMPGAEFFIEECSEDIIKLRLNDTSALVEIDTKQASTIDIEVLFQ